MLGIFVRSTSLSAGPLLASDWLRLVDLSSDLSGTPGFEGSDIALLLLMRIDIDRERLSKAGGQATLRDWKWFVTLS